VFIPLVIMVVYAVFMPFASAQNLNLMPMPAKVEMGNGRLVMQRGFTVSLTGAHDEHLDHAVLNFLKNLRRETGWVALDTRVVAGGGATLSIHADRASKEVQDLGEDESYHLAVSPSGARLDAPTTLGVMRGLQTFLQLVQTGPGGFTLPAVTIEDRPRFPWRGLMIDVSRHFIPIEVLKRNLDGMAAVKMNVFHWHLSDDQGFRVESRKFPKLQEMGSDGLYYTQDEIHDLIAYARDRGIRIVPEFDVPGHSTSWFVGYPDLASAPGPYQIERKFGILDPAMNPTEEHTYKFLDEFIGEMAKLFPDKYFHIGGDEVNGKQWAANPEIQKFMRSRGLKSNSDLQAYFNEHVQQIVSKHGKIMEGWDEILRPNLPRDIVIQSWRGQASLADAARQGFRGILSSGYYLDLMWPAARHYEVDPISDGTQSLTPEEQKAVLGGEACMWEEYGSPENIDSRIWPRTAVIAERLWSPQNVTDVNSMYARMEFVSHRLDQLGLTHNSNYERMLRRIAGNDDASAVKVLADVVEPVKDYAREELAATPPSSLDPLNRLVDAARPESLLARRFSGMVDEYLAGKATAEQKATMRGLMAVWQGNDRPLGVLAQHSFLLQEVEPMSGDLAKLAAAGLQAMDYLEAGENAPAEWRSSSLSLAQEALKPKAQVLLMVALPLQKLIDATGDRHELENIKK
jgi:hexosaminidase